MNRSSVTVGLLLILCLMFLAACGILSGSGSEAKEDTETASENADNDSEENEVDTIMELNRRQKDILQENGLPTEYEKLTPEQKQAIVAIEEGLKYLEKKYGKTFIYLGYVPSGVLDSEHLTCYEEGYSHDRVITVTYSLDIDRNRVFKDDYLAITASDEYSRIVKEYFEEIVGKDNAMVITDIVEINGDISGDNMIKNAEVACKVFFKKSNVEAEKLKEMTGDFAKWIIETYGGNGAYYLYILSEDAYRSLNGYNSENVLDEYGYEAWQTMRISPKGSVNME